MDQNRVLDSKNHFKITEIFDPDQHFKQDADKNLFNSWRDIIYILANKINPNKFPLMNVADCILNYDPDKCLHNKQGYAHQ